MINIIKQRFESIFLNSNKKAYLKNQIDQLLYLKLKLVGIHLNDMYFLNHNKEIIFLEVNLV